MIDRICQEHHLRKPRTYKVVLREAYLKIARSKKNKQKKIRKINRKLLNGVKRDINAIQKFMNQSYALKKQETIDFSTMQAIYAQQLEMWQKHTHQIAHRIVSFSKPWIRPIVRGKAKAKTEFGIKFEMTYCDGFVRREKSSFEAYNESIYLPDAIEHYYQREGHYPEVILADKIYRTRVNLAYCKERGIRLSGPALGRHKKDRTWDKKLQFQDNAERIEIERDFSLLKRKFSLGLNRYKTKANTEASISLSIIAMNLDRLMVGALCAFFAKGLKKLQKQLILRKMNSNCHRLMAFFF
jgi:hypothetical protein